MAKIEISGIEVEYDPVELSYENSKPLDKKNATINLLEMKKIMENKNIEIILMYGTLLGAIREKGFIEHDIDIDLICFNEIEVIKSINDLITAGFKFVRYEEISKTYSFMREDCYIDIYIVSEVKGILGKLYYNLCGKLYPKKLLKSFKEIEFIGEKFLVPARVEDNLIYCYGQDWQVPIANKPGVHESNFQIKVKKIMKSVLPKRIIKTVKNYYKNILGKK